MSFAAPWWLSLLLLLPLVGWFLRQPGGRESGALRYPDASKMPGRATARVRAARALPWLSVVVLALMIVAMARPQRLQEVGTVSSEGIDIMLALDISGSMRAMDMGARNRFEVAREVMREFIARSSGDRLGLVVFSGQAFTQCPLTTDYRMVARLLEEVEMGMVADGTAIGMAIVTAAARLEDSEAKSRVVILLTDGVNNTGAIDPITAARAAAALGIRIYPVGIGTPTGGRVPFEDPVFGGGYAREADGSYRIMEFDEEQLRQIAALTDGSYFSAEDPAALRSIYEEIRALEKSEIKTTEYRRYEELAPRLIWSAVAVLLLQIALASTWLRKIP